MAWVDLDWQVRDEFIDAQDIILRRARAFQWAAHSRYVLWHQQAKKRHSLRALRSRLHSRAVIACGNPKCRAEFVPYHASTSYCTAACRIRHLALQAHYRRRAANADKLTKVCAECSTGFVAKKTDAIYCSRTCSARVSKRNENERRKEARRLAGKQQRRHSVRPVAA